MSEAMAHYEVGEYYDVEGRWSLGWKCYGKFDKPLDAMRAARRLYAKRRNSRLDCVRREGGTFYPLINWQMPLLAGRMAYKTGPIGE